MRVSVLGAVSVASGGGELNGHALGGRRARLAIVALALADGPVPSERLAAMIWGEDLPDSWKPALRGIIRSIRTAVAGIGIGDDQLVLTAPAGYALAPGIDVDVRLAAAAYETALARLAESRPDAAVPLLLEPSEISPDLFLPSEDLGWIDEERRALAELRRSARETLVTAAGLTGDNRRAVRIARELVADDPTDESAHRTLIAALDRDGDRVGAVQAYEYCRTTLADQLGIDPSGETVAVYLAALRSSAPTTVGRLPQNETTFVGRTRELAEIGAAFGQSRLVTLTGRGGIGKSRLALAYASNATDGETLWVQLGSSTSNELVAADVARGLGANPEPDPLASLLATIAPRGRTLLVLDGCDEVSDGIATLTTSLMSGCPELIILCTSRAPLHSATERVVAIAALGSGGDAEVLLSQRIRELGSPTADAVPAESLERLARRGLGIPLALELLAAQLREISLDDLLDDIGETTDGTDQVRSILDYGYGSLTPEEAVVFRRSSVLDGAVSLGLLRGLVVSDQIPSTRVARVLGELSARGLLHVNRTGPRWRYEQHDDVREFARELLLASGEERQTFDLLAASLRAMLPEDARSAPGPFSAAITESLPSIRSLFGAALEDRASLADAQELAFRLHRYYAATSVSEGRFWLSRLLSGRPTTPWTGLATFALGYLSYWAGDGEGAFPALKKSVDLLRGTEDSYAGRALIFLGGIADDLDRGEEAIDFVREAIAVAEELGEHNLRVGAVIGVGSLLSERVDPSAVDFAREAIELCREHGSEEQLLITLPTAAMISWQVGNLGAAHEFASDARGVLQGDPRIARVVLLVAMAGTALAEGDIEDAIRLSSAADSLGTELGVERELPLARCILARSRLTAGDTAGASAASESAFAAAEAMSTESAFALCLETAALVGSAIGADEQEVSTALESARVIRNRGSRPAPLTLQGAVDELRKTVPATDALPARDAARRAADMLNGRVRA
ncbi:MAG TPA: BTAD domain-containing putative transcriptional regulator [Galbitalea sp.]